MLGGDMHSHERILVISVTAMNFEAKISTAVPLTLMHIFSTFRSRMLNLQILFPILSLVIAILQVKF